MLKKSDASAVIEKIGKHLYYKSEDGGFSVIHGDCRAAMLALPDESVDMISADGPYFSSNDGTTVRGGCRVSVNKGGWDKSQGFIADYKFQYDWLQAVRRVLKPHG